MQMNMRTFPLLLAALAACSSDSITGAVGPDGEILETEVSQTSVTPTTPTDFVEVTVHISNPTHRTLRLHFGSQYTYAELTQGTTTYAVPLPTAYLDTTAWIMAPGDKIALGATAVTFSPGYHISPSMEQLQVPDGQYMLRACAVVPSASASGLPLTTTCGNSVAFTLGVPPRIAKTQP